MLTIRTLEKSWIRAWLAGVILCVVAISGAGAEESNSTAPFGFSGLTATDSVRTNLWICEALMEEVAGYATRNLNPAPGAVRVEPRGKMEGEEFLGQAIFEVLTEAGYEVFTDVGDTSRQAAVDYIYAYNVKGIELSYPRAGRTLGLWRQWVDRDLSISADIEILEAGTGKVLFKDLVVRRFSDRIGAGDLGMVNSKIFSFTSAETSESGWRRRLEEIVVAGTLTGMVVVYFANTGS